MTLPKCPHPGCEGHLGKFSSCLHEWLYECSLSDSDETFGDTDWLGHYAILTISDDPSWTASGEEYGGHPLVPAPGTYLVFTWPSGAVNVTRYDSPEACEKDISTDRVAYESWARTEGDEQ